MRIVIVAFPDNLIIVLCINQESGLLVLSAYSEPVYPKTGGKYVNPT